MATINRFVDSGQLNDSGNGSTEALAKKNLRTAFSLLNYNDDQIIWLRPGRYYSPDTVGQGIGAIARPHVKVRPWNNGESGNPVIDGRNWIAPNTTLFTLEGAADGGGYVWSIIVGTENRVSRVFAASQNNGILLHQRTMGEGLGPVPDTIDTTASPATLAKIKAALNPTDCWFGSKANLGYRLYMWTPFMDMDPSAYYQGLSFYQFGAGTYGFDYGIAVLANSANHAQDVTITSIDVIGSVLSNFAVFADDDKNRPVRSVTFDRCNALAVYNSAWTIRQKPTAAGIASGVNLVSDVLVKNFIANTNTSAKEEERTKAYGNFTGGDMLSILDRVDNVVFEDGLVIDARHSALAMGNFFANSTVPTRSGFRRITVKASAGNTYARGAGISNTDATCFLDQITFDGMNVCTQLAGSVRLSNSAFVNARLPMRMTENDAVAGHIAIGAYVIDRYDGGATTLGNERYIYTEPKDVRIINVSFGPHPSPGSPSIKFDTHVTRPAGMPVELPNATFPAGAVKIDDSLIVDTAPMRQGKPTIVGIENGGNPLGNPAIDNVAIYKGAGQTATSTWKGATASITATPGATNVLTADPKVDKDLKPRPGSPLVGLSRVKGRPVSDITGRERPVRGTIGAFEDFRIFNRRVRP